MSSDIVDIKDAPVCPDFDEDCRDVVDPEQCMRGGQNADGSIVMLPIIGICLELQRRQQADS